MTDTSIETSETFKDQKDPKDAPMDPEQVSIDPKDDQKDQEQVPEDREEPTSFPAAYVKELRRESKTHREDAVEAQKRADFYATECRRLAVAEGTRGVLTDPAALAWQDEWDDGEHIDHAAIRAAAQALAGSKPWLSRPRGNVGQGEHSATAQPDSLSALLQRL